MSDHVCVCRCCVDPRENGFSDQHGLPIYNGIYSSRVKGAFMAKPSTRHEVSNTSIMLLQMGKKPLAVMQSHHDCAAIGVLFAAEGKAPSELNETERQFLASHGESLQAVKKYAAGVEPKEQLRILGKLSALQNINNLFSFIELNKRADYRPAAYAYYSLTRPRSEPQPANGSEIGLMIFDPAQGMFASAEHGNVGIRLADLIDPDTFTSRAPASFEITRKIDLDEVAYNEVVALREGLTPHVGHDHKDVSGTGIRTTDMKLG